MSKNCTAINKENGSGKDPALAGASRAVGYPTTAKITGRSPNPL